MNSLSNFPNDSINWPLVPAAAILFFCASIGCVGNAIMIICFFREKKFNSTCHYLITINCFADLLHVSGHYIIVYQIFSNEFSTQETCFWMLLPCLAGVFISGPLLVEMGLDRLIACKWPFLYRKLLDYPKLYLVLYIIFPIGYSAWFMYSAFLSRSSDVSGLCIVSYAMGYTVLSTFNRIGIIINLSIMIIYFITYLQLKSFRQRIQNKAVFKSIGCTVIFVLAGWMSLTILVNLRLIFLKDPSLTTILSIYSGLGVDIACSCNVFVFYSISSEYREEIRKTLGMKVADYKFSNGSQVSKIANANDSLSLRANQINSAPRKNQFSY